MNKSYYYLLIGIVVVLILIVPMILRKEQISASNDTTHRPQLIEVEIKGEVMMPGTYLIKEGLLLKDLIRFAQGLTSDADISQLNQFAILEDKQVYHINKVFVNDDIKDKRININQATLIELMSLKGIGEVTANNIILYRKNHGPFISILDIKKVTGIGEKTYEQIKDYIKT